MLKIWGRPNSINVQKVLWLAHELNLDFEHEIAGMAHGKVNEPWYREMNPNGRVPTIEDDGTVLWESNVVVRYLASKHASGSWIPETLAGRAEAEMWMDWQQTTVHPFITPVFWNIIRTPASGPDQSAIDAGVKGMHDAFAMLNSRLEGRDFVLGDRITVADIPLGCAAYRWYAMPVDHGDFPNVRAWYDRLTTRPPYQEHVMMTLT